MSPGRVIIKLLIDKHYIWIHIILPLVLNNNEQINEK